MALQCKNAATCERLPNTFGSAICVPGVGKTIAMRGNPTELWTHPEADRNRVKLAWLRDSGHLIFDRILIECQEYLFAVDASTQLGHARSAAFGRTKRSKLELLRGAWGGPRSFRNHSTAGFAQPAERDLPRFPAARVRDSAGVPLPQMIPRHCQRLCIRP